MQTVSAPARLLDRLSQAVERLATPRNILLLFLVLLPFIGIFFPWRSCQLERLAGYPPPVLDVRWPYTPQDVHRLAGDLGQAGRRLYAWTEVTLDFAFPVLYAAWLSLALALVWRKARPGWPGLRKLILLPYLGMLADLAENTVVAVLMLLFPGEPAWLVALANLASLLQWTAGLASLAAILFGLGWWIIDQLRPDSPLRS